MILKEDHRVKVELVDNLIVKTFKPGWECPQSPKWMVRINEFSVLYGHAPRIVECTPNRLVTEKVTGKSVVELLDYKNREIGFTNERKLSTTQWINNYKKAQSLYFQMINNFLEYNLNYKFPLIHKDLNLSNMFIKDDIIVCIDVNSFTVSENPIEFNWIAAPFPYMTQLSFFPLQDFLRDEDIYKLLKDYRKSIN